MDVLETAAHYAHVWSLWHLRGLCNIQHCSPASGGSLQSVKSSSSNTTPPALHLPLGREISFSFHIQKEESNFEHCLSLSSCDVGIELFPATRNTQTQRQQMWREMQLWKAEATSPAETESESPAPQWRKMSSSACRDFGQKFKQIKAQIFAICFYIMVTTKI